MIIFTLQAYTAESEMQLKAVFLGTAWKGKQKKKVSSHVIESC